MTQLQPTAPAAMIASSPIDPHATADAAALIATHRRNAAGLIPSAAWAMLAHAEDRLNQELKEYFHGNRESSASTEDRNIEDPHDRARA